VKSRYDIAVIGAGPGGYVAAIRAAQRGASVALIEKDAVGGVCLNRGCIPTKTLITAAKRYKIIREADEWGFSTGNVSFDWKAIVARKDRVVAQLVSGVEFLLRKNKVHLIRGRARLERQNHIVIETPGGSEAIEADKSILATGSEPAMIPAFHIDRKYVVTSDEALIWDTLPESVVIVGGGVIGCEFAMLFNTFGVKVTILETLPSILALTSLSSFIIKRLQSIMKKGGISLVLNSKIKEIRVNVAAVTVTLEDGRTFSAEKALVSIGRSINTKGLGLGDVGVALGSHGEVIINDKMQTNIPGIYAIGDMTGKAQLAHLASFQGIVAAEDATGNEANINYEVVPSCIFTDPPAATVGISTEEAKERGIEAGVGRFPYRASGKAVSSGETEGFIEAVAEKASGLILGAHILGEGAPELIHELALAMQYNLTVRDVMQLIHAHPTYSEAIGEACESIFGISIHS